MQTQHDQKKKTNEKNGGDILMTLNVFQEASAVL